MKFSYNAQVLCEGALIPLYKKLKRNDTVNGTVELLDAHLRFHAGFENTFDLGTHRPAQHKYVENEKNWYLSMNRNIKGFPGIENNPTWCRIATEDGMVNSNYGWCVFSPENGMNKKNQINPCDPKNCCNPNNDNCLYDTSQYDFALKQLIDNPLGRQSIIYYSRPQMQWEYNDGIHAKSDFTCTINTQHFIRKTADTDYLHYIVNMRSNDAIFGLHCGDFPWHMYVYNKLLNDINKYRKNNNQSLVHAGEIFWNAASLHVYERHYKLLTNIAEEYLDWQKSEENDS